MSVFHRWALRAAFLAVSLHNLSCRSAEAEWLVRVDTDAVVPDDPEGRAVIFDRLTVDVLREDGSLSPEGTRTFALNHRAFVERRVSFGVPATPGQATRVRLRIWFSENGVGYTDADATVGVFELPALADGERRRMLAQMETARIGAPNGAGLRDDDDAPSFIGTGAAAARVPCKGEPTDERVCVPGGLFWMGEPLSGEARLAVRLSPFWVDSMEVRADAYKAAEGRTTAPPRGRDTFVCNTEAPARGAHPANCVLREDASAFCRSRGGRLPTTAEFEYVATGLGTRLFPTGERPTCVDAAISRTGTPPTCPGRGTVAVWALRDDYRGDVVTLPAGQVYDLFGNLTEFVGDDFALSLGCFRGAALGIVANPFCRERTSMPSARGGSFLALQTPRDAQGPPSANYAVGFRCVYDAL